MQHTSRRRLLQLSSVGALTAASAGLAGIFASGRAPAFAQGVTLHWVRGSDYVPVSDQTLRGKILEQCQKDLGIKFNLETIDALTTQARITSAVSSGTGPDIICVFNNWAQLYAESVADVSDIAEEIGKSQGGYYETAKAIAYDGKKWLRTAKFGSHHWWTVERWQSRRRGHDAEERGGIRNLADRRA